MRCRCPPAAPPTRERCSRSPAQSPGRLRHCSRVAGLRLSNSGTSVSLKETRLRDDPVRWCGCEHRSPVSFHLEQKRTRLPPSAAPWLPVASVWDLNLSLPGGADGPGHTQWPPLTVDWGWAAVPGQSPLSCCRVRSGAPCFPKTGTSPAFEKHSRLPLSPLECDHQTEGPQPRSLAGCCRRHGPSS